MGVDPLGLEVSAIADLSTGTVTVTDNDTGETATAQFFSGGTSKYDGNNYQSIPKGEYFINGLTKNNYYRLTANDSRIDDYIDNSTSNYDPNEKMSSVRFHWGLESHACITVSNLDEWEKIKSILGKTKRGKMTFADGSVFQKRGTMKVIGEGNGDQTQRP